MAVKVIRGGAFVAEARVRLFRREAETLASAYNLALIYASQDRYGEAERLFKETLAAQRQALALLAPDRPERAALLRQLAEFEARLAGTKDR